ncbi:purine/pyrimidine permease [Effusibacillus dendaii]|uniref:Putative purine permease YwdJ n=1 Tax=Effusibacillus dendaii TaxID=2743772 RepID=A0A7I8DGZ3_9BACL|nr:purine/pyrimidine permease [Effusibacillus dendaii]BCJ87071.1 putative purine permease YwdJ [Effusibacillus dendaii]
MSSLLYRLDQKPPLWMTVVSAVQWFMITLTSSLVVPLVISQAFGLDQAQTAQFMQLTFFLVGIVSLLQVWFGHRYPIMEGPAGMWWGIFLIVVNIGMASGLSAVQVGQSLEAGLMCIGMILFLLGLFGLVNYLRNLFTPLVSGCFMLILPFSMSGTFVQGMLGVGQSGKIQAGTALVALLVLALTIWLSQSRWKWFRTFSILIALLTGWLIYILLGWAAPVQKADSWFTVPHLLFWGTPRLDWGIVFISILTGLILISNLITSISVTAKAAGEEPTKRSLNRGGQMTGVAHFLSGMGGVVGLVPLSIAAGVIEMTGMAARLPFVIASFLMISLGFFPFIGLLFAAIPVPVGYAVLFVTFTQLVGFGLRDLQTVQMEPRNVMTIGLSLMFGIGVMFLPKTALQGINPVLADLLGNGLIVGVIAGIVLEQIVFRRRPEAGDSQQSA